MSAVAVPLPSSPPALVADYVQLEGCVSAALHGSCLPMARVVPAELVRVIVSFLWSPLTSASRQLDNPRQRALWTPSLAICTGWVHADTEQFDDWTSELRQRVMAGWRLSAIDGCGDRYCNGFSFTYSSPSGDETLSTEIRKGSHHRPRMSRLQLAAGESIVQVAVRLSKWMECCVFETSEGRRFQVGGRGSRWAPKEKQATEWTHAGVTQLLLMPQPQQSEQTGAERRYEALAFTYGVGGHIHNLGVYYQGLHQPPRPMQPTIGAPAIPPSAASSRTASAAVSRPITTDSGEPSRSPIGRNRESRQGRNQPKSRSPDAVEEDLLSAAAAWSVTPSSPTWLTHSTSHQTPARLPLLSS